MNLLSNFFSNVRRIRLRIKKILFINQRNLNYIYPYNNRCDYPLADNKILTKDLLQKINMPVAKTYVIYQYFYDLLRLKEELLQYSSFVIKPAGGKGGGGILVIAERQGDSWKSVNGKLYNLEQIRKHISDIIFGVYSFGLNDAAIMEARIIQHKSIEPLSPYGLADVRVIVKQHQPIIAMIRLATKNSNGTANLHQGAVGVGIDIDAGRTNNAALKGEYITTHPDTKFPLLNIYIAFWQELLTCCKTVSTATPLKYLGIDIAISDTGPIILEVNVRPGIEIQTANGFGMRNILEYQDSQSAQ